jgi:phenylalanyl-tRNA synthetase beta chain
MGIMKESIFFFAFAFFLTQCKHIETTKPGCRFETVSLYDLSTSYQRVLDSKIHSKILVYAPGEMGFLNLDQNQKISFVLKQQHTQPWQHPVRSAEIQIDEKSIGSLYELHPLVGDRLGINERVGVLEIDLARLEEFSTLSFKVNALPTFPEVTRDFAFLVPTTVHHQEIISLLSSLNPLIKKVELFDVYSGDKVPKDTKSMAYRITLWNNERTLAATEIEEVEKQIVTALKDTVKAQLRV